MSLALIGNPELRPFSLQIRAAEARTLQADRPPNPEVESLTEDFGGSRVRRGFTESQTTLALSQLIELGAKRAKRVRLARLDENLAAWDYETKRLDVFVGTTRGFAEVLAAQRRVEMTEASLRLERQLYNSVGERVRAGQVSPLEQSRTQVTLSAGQVARDRALRDLQVARSRLAALWGSTHPIFQRALGDLGDVKPIRPLPDLLRMAADNPDLARWSTEIAQREARVALERAKNIPDPRITLGARRYGYNTGETAFVAGVSIPLPFYSLNRGNLLEAEVQANRSRALRQQESVRVASAIEQSFEQVSAAYDAVVVLRRDVLPAAQSTFDGMSTGYREGKFTLLEVLDAQRVLLDARVRLIEAEAAYQGSVADTERLTGQSLRTRPGHVNGGEGVGP
ncbi:MAG: TolC family protein [Alphaproteobacteria bacterium]|nr:TolC family protein [Alphaproteobacteria bacterium]